VLHYFKSMLCPGGGTELSVAVPVAVPLQSVHESFATITKITLQSVGGCWVGLSSQGARSLW